MNWRRKSKSDWGRLDLNFKNLSKVSDYVNERVKVENLTVENYISTENMLPNKGGIDKAIKLPAAKTTSLYSKGDILLSNIRTYFKKIWYAEKDGGCSNDVLVVRARGEIEPKFLYYVLSNDKFFEYSSATSKGTKMPRGDKSAIMQYQIPDMPLEEQRTIVGVLSALDDRIAENKKINHHLELMAQAIFKSWFIDYENSTDFVETEIGMIPSSWKVVSLSEIAEISNGYSYKGKELKESSTAMATIKNFDRNGGFKSNGFKELVPSDKIKPTHFVSINEILIAHTDLTQNADIIGNSEILLNDFGYDAIVASMDLVKINSKISGISNYTLLLMTKNELFKQYCLGFVNGTTVLHLSKKAVPNYKLAIPSSEKIFKEFNSLVEPLFERMKVVIKETESLISLRDSLLPKLMSGEIKVCDYAAK